jgi:hypothetical protein
VRGYERAEGSTRRPDRLRMAIVGLCVLQPEFPGLLAQLRVIGAQLPTAQRQSTHAARWASASRWSRPGGSEGSAVFVNVRRRTESATSTAGGGHYARICQTALERAAKPRPPSTGKGSHDGRRTSVRRARFRFALCPGSGVGHGRRRNCPYNFDARRCQPWRAVGAQHQCFGPVGDHFERP